MNDLYKDNIIDHYKTPRHFGQVDQPTVSHQEVNSLCGDQIRMDLIIKNDKILEVKFSGNGCAISMASASMLSEKISRKKIKEAAKINRDQILEMLNIPMSPTRLKCALLPWEVLQKTLQKYRTKKL